MLQLQKREDYAFLFMRELALSGDQYVSLSDFARDNNVSMALAKQFATALRRAHLIESKEGSGGGFRLARHPDQITFSDIVASINGPIILSDCSSHNHNCRLGTVHCSLRDQWSDVSSRLNDILTNLTLSELVKG